MKLINIVNSYDSLCKLAEIDLPICISFNITDILLTIENHINNYNDKKNKLAIKYGTSTDLINYKILDENKDKFIKELYELENLDVDLKFDKITLPDNINISANILYNLRDYIKR